MNSVMKYSILIPAHNEEKNIGSLISSIMKTFPDNQIYEIYIAEDGSTDRTRSIVTKLIQESEYTINLSPVSPRLGYSRAIINAIQSAKGEWLLFLDGDGQTAPEDAVQLLNYAKNGAVVIGVRSHRADSLPRKLASRSFGLLYILLGFPKLKDPSSGTILVKKSEIEAFAAKPIRLKYGLWWEFQAWARSAMLTTIEIPITHKNREYGNTQVYLGWRTLLIGITHAFGLLLLKNDLRKTKSKR